MGPRLSAYSDTVGPVTELPASVAAAFVAATTATATLALTVA